MVKSPKRPTSGENGKSSKSPEKDESHDGDVDMKDESKPKTNSSKKQKQELSARELRVQRREQQSARKSQNMGVGISAENAPKGKKIIFGDDENVNDDDIVEKEETLPKEAPSDDEKDEESDMDEEKVQEEGGDDDDDDDDAVEEMDTAVAREQVQEQRGKERATARSATALVKPRRQKRKKQREAAEAAENENEFDDDFFAQLDEEMTEDQKQAKERKLTQPKGRHTTFVVPDEDATGTSVPAQHNIEVAILGEVTDQVILNTEQTETALLFSRSLLANGSDGVSAKQLQKAKQQGKKTAETPSWQRSKKMNRMLLPGARSSRGKGQAKAAAHFVCQA